MIEFLKKLLNSNEQETQPAVRKIEKNEMQKPSIGRVVVYNHPGSADGLHPRKQSPAIVQKVNGDGSVELFVMSVYGGIFFNHNVEMVDPKGSSENGMSHKDSRWEWPERVE